VLQELRDAGCDVGVGAEPNGPPASSATRTRLPSGTTLTTRPRSRFCADPCGRSDAGSKATSQGWTEAAT